MIPRIPTATWRVQLRDGVDFDALRLRLDRIAGLGVSHVYLSPIFAATSGSTHGYDVTDPTRIDDQLGGAPAFEALAQAARDRGLGLILDIVPNHTAFSVENPWLADVLARGRASPRARHFDIDWQAGPLILPWLPRPFEQMLREGAFRIQDGLWHVGDLAVPMAPGTTSTDDLRALHEAQHWRLVPAAQERDAITHRRFFNVTDLIGMRVEDPGVFADTHALILDLVARDLVQGLRVDHVDGLVDPASYLDRLAEAVPGTPIWVEKILTGDEALPKAWPVAGTTGYEAGCLLTRMLTRAEGVAALDRHWRHVTGDAQDFPEALIRAKHEILDHELAAERRQMARLARLAVQDLPEADFGPETLREAVTALLVAVPRYRSYVAGLHADDRDRAMIADVADRAAAGLRCDRAVRVLAALWADPVTPAQRDFVRRLQQVSGALLAKAQEDTAGFRWTRYLPANEVGAEPDHPAIDAAEARRLLAARRPGDMVLTSSHDSKRSEDARARLIAASHLPRDLIALDHVAAARDADLDPRWRWYVVQTVLALQDAPDAADRIAQHLQKALREAKLTSFWTRPDTALEERAAALAADLLGARQADRPAALERLLARGDALMLAQLLFKMIMPGFPDIYQGTQHRFLALTDPDNRRPVDWSDDPRDASGAPEDAGAVKARWTRWLLAMRRQGGAWLAEAPAGDEDAPEVEIDAHRIALTRRGPGVWLTARLILPGGRADQPDPAALLEWNGQDGSRVMLTGQGPDLAPIDN